MSASRTLLNKQGLRKAGRVASARRLAPLSRSARMNPPFGRATPSREQRAEVATYAAFHAA